MTNDIEIISRKEAKERGLKRYFTGKPCKHGHIAERYTSTGTCCECLAEHRKQNKDKLSEYKREYYAQNKDKVLEKNREYRKQNKDYFKERRKQNKDYFKEYYKQNKDYFKEYRKQNRDYFKEYRKQNRDYFKEYRKQNKDKILEKNREYRKQNKDKMAESCRRWRKQNPSHEFLRGSLKRIFNNWKGGRKKMEKLHGYTFEQLVTRIGFQFKDGMSWDNRSEWHIDHKKPISRFLEQGITDPKIINALSNLQPIWASENLSKGAQFEL